VKRLISFAAVFALWPLASCGGGDGTLESCVGPYTGTFTVDTELGKLEGRILARLGLEDVTATEPQLDFRFTFDTETETEIPEMAGAAQVSDAGEVSPGMGFDLVGNFDFEACEASGTWTEGTLFTNGTWRLSSGHSAF
jgi:hypothetical protein